MDVHIHTCTYYNHIVRGNFAGCYIMRLVAPAFGTRHQEAEAPSGFCGEGQKQAGSAAQLNNVSQTQINIFSR